MIAIIDIYYNKYLLQLYLYVKLFILLPTHTYIFILYIREFSYFNWTFLCGSKIPTFMKGNLI